MDEALERRVQEKIIEIEKIKDSERAAFAAAIVLPVGVGLIIIYFSRPDMQSYFGVMLLLGILFSLIGIWAIYDIKYGFPKRLQKAEAEYEELARQRGTIPK